MPLLRDAHSVPLGTPQLLNKKNNIKNMSKSWKLVHSNANTSQKPPTHPDHNNQTSSASKKEQEKLIQQQLKRISTQSSKFNPRHHGFQSTKDVISVKIVEEKSNKSLGSVVVRCGTPISYIRSVLSSGEVEDSSGFLFVAPEMEVDASNGDIAGVIDEPQERKMKIGQWAPKRSASKPLLPAIGNGNGNGSVSLGANVEEDQRSEDNNNKNNNVSQVDEDEHDCRDESADDAAAAPISAASASAPETTIPTVPNPNPIQNLKRTRSKDPRAKIKPTPSPFSKSELLEVVSFMDPNNDGEISYSEVSISIPILIPIQQTKHHMTYILTPTLTIPTHLAHSSKERSVGPVERPPRKRSTARVAQCSVE